jgi:hypothetical protein
MVHTGSNESIQSKERGDDVENLQHPTHATFYEKDEIAKLSPEHRDYLMQRHGTLELDPVPAFGDADPYNWPAWKVS